MLIKKNFRQHRSIEILLPLLSTLFPTFHQSLGRWSFRLIEPLHQQHGFLIYIYIRHTKRKGNKVLKVVFN